MKYRSMEEISWKKRTMKKIIPFMFRLSLYQEKYIENMKKDIMKLTQRESAVIRLRYGIALGDHFTHQEIADIVGISRTMVLLLEKRALRKLKHITNRERMLDLKETLDLIDTSKN